MNGVAEKRAIRFVVLVVLIDAMGFGIVMPVLPRIVMELGHVDLAEATRIGGWLGIVYAGVQFLTGPLMGNLGDRFGRRPVILGSLVGFAVDYALMGFAPSLWWLFLGRTLAGLFGASYGPAGAVLADVTAPEDRAKAFGMLGAAFGVGFVIGPAIGGLLGEMGARAPFYAAAALAGINALIGLTLFPETLRDENRRPFSWRRANPVGALFALRGAAGVLPIAFAMFWWNLAGMVYPAAWSFFAIAAFGWTPGFIGLSLAWAGILMAAAQMLLVGPMVKRFGERRAAEIGIVAATLEFLAYLVIREGWMVFAIMIVLMIQSCVMPALSGMMSRRVAADQQGELQGFNGSLQAIGAIVAPALYNPALAWFTGPRAPIFLPSIIFVLAAVAGVIALVTLIVAPRAEAPA
jgi:MFS transporter, DHA1 family, tetracycline resistance protein